MARFSQVMEPTLQMTPKTTKSSWFLRLQWTNKRSLRCLVHFGVLSQKYLAIAFRWSRRRCWRMRAKTFCINTAGCDSRLTAGFRTWCCCRLGCRQVAFAIVSHWMRSNIGNVFRFEVILIAWFSCRSRISSFSLFENIWNKNKSQH